MSEYHENPEQKDFPDFLHTLNRWQKRREVKAQAQVKMYKRISNVWCIGKAVLDAGCGIGIGTNILGHNALGVLGVDNNQENVDFAKGLYESPKVKFEVMDLLKEPERPIATFDIVTCIEVIEHVKDRDILLNGLKKFYDPKRRTVFFISSPNRNNEKLGKDHPNNPYHTYEFTAGEFYEIMTKHFKNVVLYSVDKLDTFGQEETVDGNTTDTPLLAKCEDPI